MVSIIFVMFILKDDYYITVLKIGIKNTYIILYKMLPKILRIGPLFLLQIGLILSSLYTRYVGNFSQCRMLALISISALLFLFEMFIVYRIVRKSKKLRKKYITELVLMKQAHYYSISVYNSIMVSLPILYLYITLVIDGFSLGTFKKDQPQCQNQCQFFLFPLCMYNSTFGKQINVKDQIMVLWLLYTCFLVAFSIITAVVCMEMQKYYKIVIKNRKYAHQVNFSMFQSLLNCQIIYSNLKQKQAEHIGDNSFKINQSCAGNQSNKLYLTVHTRNFKHQIDESCPICLKPFSLLQNTSNKQQYMQDQNAIIQLQCRHQYHKSCIINWLQVKDSCPFRCGQQ